MNNELIKYYWSREPGKILNKHTGVEFKDHGFFKNGLTVQEWYQTLMETIIDVSSQHFKNTYKNGYGQSANKLVVSKSVYPLIFAMIMHKPSLEEGNFGTLNNIFSIHVVDKEEEYVVDVYYNDVLVGNVIILDSIVI